MGLLLFIRAEQYLRLVLVMRSEDDLDTHNLMHSGVQYARPDLFATMS
jgi:hypothetical protein